MIVRVVFFPLILIDGFNAPESDDFKFWRTCFSRVFDGSLYF